MSKHDTVRQGMQPATADGAEPARLNPWQGLRDDRQFFENDEVATLVQRGLFYARAGVPIHFQGAAGRGKTAIALQIAKRLGRPIAVMTGHDWMTSNDLIGREVGQSTRAVVDKYIQRVRRSETTVRHDWEHSLLADAMLHGHTLVYDEFTRASAESNGILLSVLEEGVLISTDRLAQQAEVRAHADFRIILTSNPSDYAGVNTAPDALLDRMITFPLHSYSAETEAGIVAARTGIAPDLANRIVRLVHHFASTDDGPCSMRAAIMIARIAAVRLRQAELSDALLSQIAADVLRGRGITQDAAQIARQLATNANPEERS
ncbi:MAG: AAA family ATPase [Pseudomonadota bacterium]